MKFEIRTDRLDKIATAAGNTIGNTKLSISPDGRMSIDQLDDADTIFLDIDVPVSTFESFDPEGTQQEMTVGVNWDDASPSVSDVVGEIGCDTVNCELDFENGNWIFTTNSGFEYKMALLDIGGLPSGTVPDVDFDNEFTTTAGDLLSVVSKSNLVRQSSDSIHIEVRGDKDSDDQCVLGWARGDTNDVEDRIIGGLTGYDNVHTKMSTELIKDSLKAVDSDTTVDVRMYYDGGRGNGRNYPVEMEFEHGPMQITMWIAPRTQE